MRADKDAEAYVFLESWRERRSGGIQYAGRNRGRYGNEEDEEEEDEEDEEGKEKERPKNINIIITDVFPNWVYTPNQYAEISEPEEDYVQTVIELL